VTTIGTPINRSAGGRPWAQLDAIDFGEQFGLLDSEEVQRRRQEAEAAFRDPAR
jgi:hypothetical protein